MTPKALLFEEFINSFLNHPAILLRLVKEIDMVDVVGVLLGVGLATRAVVMVFIQFFFNLFFWGI